MALYPRNANDIVIDRLRVRATGVAIEDAVLTVVITDLINDDVIATEGPMTHTGDGNYYVTTTAQLTAGIRYKTVVTAASPYVFSREIIETCLPPGAS